MTQRRDIKYIFYPQFLGEEFVENLPQDLRRYSRQSSQLIAQPINAWLSIAGALFIVMVIMGFIIERRLYKTSSL
jgi:hypothetical protein